MISRFLKKKNPAPQPPTPAESARDRMRRLTKAIEEGRPVETPTPPGFTSRHLEKELGGDKDPNGGTS